MTRDTDALTSCACPGQDLVKHTHPSHPDYPALSDARTKMQELAVFINIQKKEAENIYEVIAIQDKLIGKFEVRTPPPRHPYPTSPNVRWRANSLSFSFSFVISLFAVSAARSWRGQNIVVPGRMYVFEGVMAEIQLAPNSKGKIQKMSNTMRKKSLASPPTERSGARTRHATRNTQHATRHTTHDTRAHTS